MPRQQGAKHALALVCTGSGGWYRRTLAMAPYQASLKVDFDQRKPMEVEAIFGNPVRAALAAGGAMPLVDMLYRQLTFLDGRRR